MKYTGWIITINLLVSMLLLAQNNEFLLDTNLTYLPALNGQECSVIASDGKNYFVAWYDYRNIIYQEEIYNLSIYGCRVNSEGVVLDSAGILISNYVMRVSLVPWIPAIAYGNGVYFFVWTDYRDLLVHGARIDTNGVVLDPDGFVLTHCPGYQYSPSIAFDGKNFLIAWFDFGDPHGSIYACRVSPEGEILDPEGIVISDHSPHHTLSVSFGLTNYLVVWADQNENICGVRVDTAGTVLDTAIIEICADGHTQLYAAIAFDGTNYLVVWEDGRLGSNRDIFGTRVDTAGVVLDTNGFAISVLPEWESCPSVTFGKSNYLVTWDKYCARVDTSGIVLDTTPTVVSQDGGGLPSGAFNGINYFVTWSSLYGFYEGDIYGTQVDTSAVVFSKAPILLSMAAYQGLNSAAAFDGSNYFVVWTDYRDTTAAYIYGTRIDTLGAVLDLPGIPLIKGEDPAIGFDGSNYFVACNGIKGIRFDTTGNILDSTLIHAGGSHPAMIFDNENYFVTWDCDYCIYGARIETSGVLIDTNAIRVSQDGYYLMYPATTFDGANYFVVWQYYTLYGSYDVYGARVTTSGIVLDSPSIHIAIGTGWECQCYPSVSFDGTNYLVVWEDYRSGDADIYGARVSTNGVVLNPGGIPICTAPSAQYKPEIKFDGHNYCVIWEDWRNGEYTDIYGCYVTTSGAVTQEFVVADQPNLQLEPTLVKGPDKFLVTYTGFVDTLNGRPANTMRIWAKFQEFVGIEESKIAGSNVSYLFQNYPNPFMQKTVITYQVGQNTQDIELKIYDITGRLVKSFKELSNYQAPFNLVVWDGKDELGHDVGAGIYFYQLKIENFNAVKKMILLK